MDFTCWRSLDPRSARQTLGEAAVQLASWSHTIKGACLISSAASFLTGARAALTAIAGETSTYSIDARRIRVNLMESFVHTVIQLSLAQIASIVVQQIVTYAIPIMEEEV
jgi:uncharacterized membrane protein